MTITFAKAPNGFFCDQDPGEPSRPGQPRWSVGIEEGAILRHLFYGRKNVLEIGTGLGVSTGWIAKSVETLYTCDIDPWVQQNIWPLLPANVRPVPNLDNLPVMDGAFIDGDHRYEGCLADIQACLRIVKPDGFLVFHDFAEEGVRKAMRECNLVPVAIRSYTGLALALLTMKIGDPNGKEKV